ncbi:MAG: translation initiation factor IF-2 [Nanoarchaeota archaeon]|nr:translation initiation factor IF-2 [Nanoarchaeota archaeon]
MALRSPMCVVLAHVDHGKTTILDTIRGTAITSGEAGGITQAIGASIIPMDTVKKVCGSLLGALNIPFTIPGLVFIDTPGHASFTSLRKRGGSLADIAILVVDVNEGLKPQTIESIEILKTYKVPFVIAMNKIDLLYGWKVQPEVMLIPNITSQTSSVQQLIEGKLYELVGSLAEHGLDAERFDRVGDFTKRVAIVPTSAKTTEGIAELLMVITGLAQKYLENKLKVDVEGNAKCSILEVKEVKGLGLSMDVIVYDGTLRKGDTIVVGTLNEPIVTKVRGLFEPKALSELRDSKAKFEAVEEAVAATGVRIIAPDVEGVLSGMPIQSCSEDEIDAVKEAIKSEIEEVLIQTDKEGIVIKADTLGSLEALEKMLRDIDVSIKRASIGPITKKDIADAEANVGIDALNAVVLGFNVDDASGNEKESITVFTNQIIYKLIEDFEKWREESQKSAEACDLAGLMQPVKGEIMKGHIFRQNNPAVVGMEILGGTLKTGMKLMKDDGIAITTVKSMQLEQKNIEAAEKGKQVAVSLEDVTVGRQIHEGTVLYSAIPEEHFRKLRDLKANLSDGQKSVLKQIAEIKRKENPLWGV